MLAIHAVSTATLFTALLLSDKCLGYPSIRQRQEPRPLCEGCGDACDQCPFGVIKSAYCGVRECRRGPGQPCGGPSETFGVCGDGLSCNCNRCSGCSLDTLQCFHNPCMPHQTLESRHVNIFDLFPPAQ